MHPIDPLRFTIIRLEIVIRNGPCRRLTRLVLGGAEVTFPHAVHGGAIKFAATTNVERRRKSLVIYADWVVRFPSWQGQEIPSLDDENTYPTLSQTIG